MSGWAARRFWAEAAPVPCDGGFEVHLDTRPVRTPRKAPLVLPTLALARAIADEWQAQEGTVRPATMPFTRMANSALDKVAPQHAAVVAEVARYGATDLLCYRAEGPAALTARQAAAWDPLLAWAGSVLQAPLVVTTGIVPVAQPAESLARLALRVRDTTPFALVALHDLTAVTGSLVLGLAVGAGRLSPAEAFDLSRIDETWQAEQWGHDAEAAAAETLKRQAMQDAGRFLRLCRQAVA
ncbi:MAG: ATP12 family chaperone protein [Gemmobacter sp.]